MYLWTTEEINSFNREFKYCVGKNHMHIDFHEKRVILCGEDNNIDKYSDISNWDLSEDIFPRVIPASC